MATSSTATEYSIPVLGFFPKLIISAAILGVGGVGMVILMIFKQTPADKEDKTQIPLVEVFNASEFDEKLEISVGGQVVASKETQVAARVSGTVKTKRECCERGRFVNKDDILLEIDQTDLLLEQSRLEAEMAQSTSMLNELETEMAGAKKDIELAKEEVGLLQAEKERKEKIQESISQTTLDQAKRALISARKSLQNLENSLAMMESRKTRLNSGIQLVQASLDKIELDLKRTLIRAPISGVIVDDPIEEGSYITVGGVVAAINDTSKVEVACNLRIDQLEWLIENSGDLSDPQQAFELPPTRVQITTNSGEEAGVWHGDLTRYDGVGLDEVTKTVPVKVDVDETVVNTPRGYRALIQNTYVNVKITVDLENDSASKKFLTFPASAIQPGNFVWIVENEKLKRCDVTIVNQRPADEAKQLPQMVVVLMDNGLKAGDKIVTSPVAQPIEGATVREQDAT